LIAGRISIHQRPEIVNLTVPGSGDSMNIPTNFSDNIYPKKQTSTTMIPNTS
jgi:hypothetical protein